MKTQEIFDKLCMIQLERISEQPLVVEKYINKYLVITSDTFGPTLEGIIKEFGSKCFIDSSAGLVIENED